MEYIVEDGVVYTQYETAGGSVIKAYHDTQYHLRLTAEDGEVTATIYDYLGEPQETDGVTVTFTVDGHEWTAETVQGVATIDAEGYETVTVTADGMRGAELVQDESPA